MYPNGPAIKGGCDTRRSIRAVSWYPAAGGATVLSRCEEGMARVFAVKVQSYVEHYECRGTNLIVSR